MWGKEDSLCESICNKAFRFPVQVRKFAKQHGFSIFDEIFSEDNLIVFSKEDNWGNWNGIYANKVEIV